MTTIETENLSLQIMELKTQIRGLTKLLNEHIGSERDLLEAWNGFEWTKKTGIKFITVLGGIIGIIWGVLQIIRLIK